jgi:hypothetical protein
MESRKQDEMTGRESAGYHVEEFKVMKDTDKNTCTVDLASVAFRFVEDMKQEALNTLNNACTKRAQENFSPSFCPAFNFAAHGYSASLIQAQLPAMIGNLKRILRGIKQFLAKPSSAGNTQSTTQEDALESIWTILNQMNLDPKRCDYQHIFRTNQDIKVKWFGNDDSKGKASSTQQGTNDPNDNEREAVTVISALNTIKDVLLEKKSERDLNDNERKSLQRARACIDNCQREMSNVLEDIKKFHLTAYDNGLTSDVIDWASGQLMYRFHRSMWKIAFDTHVWSENILPQPDLYIATASNI